MATIKTIRLDEQATAEFFGKQVSTLTTDGPFKQGRVLNLKNAVAVCHQFDGKDRKDSPHKLAFTIEGEVYDENGVGTYLLLSTLLKVVYDSTGKPVEADGSFNKAVRKIIDDNPTATIAELGSKIIDAQKDGGILCNRKVYYAKGRFGDYWSGLLTLDLVTQD